MPVCLVLCVSASACSSDSAYLCAFSSEHLIRFVFVSVVLFVRCLMSVCTCIHACVIVLPGTGKHGAVYQQQRMIQRQYNMQQHAACASGGNLMAGSQEFEEEPRESVLLL